MVYRSPARTRPKGFGPEFLKKKSFVQIHVQLLRPESPKKVLWPEFFKNFWLMIAKDVIFGPVSVSNEGQVAGLLKDSRLFLCPPPIDKRSCTPWANCNGMSKPFKRRIPQGQTRPLFYFTKFFKGMVSVENIRTQGKCSTLDPTSESRNDSSSITLCNDEILQKIDSYFDYSGVAEPIETLGVLLDAFVATGDSDEPGYTPTFLRDVSWEVTRLSAFLAYLYEHRKFMVESVKVKGNG